MTTVERELRDEAAWLAGQMGYEFGDLFPLSRVRGRKSDPCDLAYRARCAVARHLRRFTTRTFAERPTYGMIAGALGIGVATAANWDRAGVGVPTRGTARTTRSWAGSCPR